MEAAEESLQPGETLGGRYLIEAKIGEGGMGAVYRAVDERNLNRPVAIKLINSRMLQGHDQSAKIRLIREREASLRITHPNVVQVIDSGFTEDGSFYLVQEFIAGESLSSLLKRRKQLEYDEILQIVNQTGAALEAAHSEGIVHRDLKPPNIMLQNLSGGGTQVKVIDFGIAKVQESTVTGPLTTSGTFIGTAWYASPEQLESEPPSLHMDLWALAVITYEMVAGVPPFCGKSMPAVAFRQMEGARPPKELRPDLPDAAQSVILKALSYKLENRYANVHEYCLALTQALVGSLSPTGKRIWQHTLESMQPTLQTVRVQGSIDKTVGYGDPGELPTRMFESDGTLVNIAKTGDEKAKGGRETAEQPSPTPTSDNAVASSVQRQGSPPGTMWKGSRLLLYFGTALILAVVVFVFYPLIFNAQKQSAVSKNEKSDKKIVVAALSYRLLVDDNRGNPFYASGREIYRSGDRFKLLVRPSEEMHLYIFNEATNGDLNLLFPVPHLNSGASLVKKGEELTLPNKWFEFDKNVGAERLVLVLSSQPVEIMEGLKEKGKADSAGKIDGAQADKIRDWMKSNERQLSQENRDYETVVSVPAEPLVARLTLQHR